MSFSGWLKSLRNRRWSRSVRAGLARRIEAVESRQLLSASSLFVSGELNVASTAGENIVIRPNPTRASDVQVLVNGVADANLSGVRLVDVTSIVIEGGDEANNIDLSAVMAATFPNIAAIRVDGRNGHDTIIGSPDYGDSINAGDGNDAVTDVGGLNTLFGGDGNDTITGGSGNDQLIGEDGDDSITGSTGNDTIDGGNGVDTITGDDGHDSIAGGDQADSLHGNAGDDTINGAMGNDFVFGDDGNDSLLGGEWNDSLVGGNGNDSLAGNTGLDTLDGGDGDDLMDGNLGDDSLVGGNGNDQLNGSSGRDTLIGNVGNDVLNGGANPDSLFGDDTVAGTGASGNDTLIGQGGDDTLIGGNGVDSLLGGAGNDVLRSTFDQALSVTPTPSTPLPSTPPLTGNGLPDAIDSGGGTDSGTVHEMSTGSGDGSLQISVDATGTFGGSSNVFGTAGSAPFDPIGPIGPKSTTFESFVYFRPSTVTGPRQQLRQIAANVSSIRGLTNEADSTFDIGSLNFTVVQTVLPVMDASGARTGSLLTQTYRITNSGATDSNFELVRYLDSDQSFDGSFTNSGGGRLLTTAGDEVLFETDAGGTSTNTNFIGITGKGGTLPINNRFEIDSFNGLRQRIGQGSGLDGQITGDADMDGSIDAGQGYDVALGLRNTFNLVPGATTVYTTHSFFGTGFPTSVEQINQPPLAADDGPFDTISAVPVTVDVVSNDVDLDGVLDFSTVTIATPPANGTAISLGNGLIRYTSNGTFSGTDSFTYTIRDDRNGVSNAATVTINVTATDTIGDILNGGDGNDSLFGAQGGDTLNGMAGNDQLMGGFGNDLIFGGAGNDRLNGDDGNDTLNGQSGNDTVNGDAGDDTFVWLGASDGSDAVQSSDGADRVEVNGKGAADLFSVGQSGRQLQVSQGTASITVLNSVARPACIVAVVINTLGGNDQVTVNDVNNVGALVVTANGGNGDDLLTANGALLGKVLLELNGEAGNDTLVGSTDADTLRGGDGDDIIGAGAGNDTIDGGAGHDSINGQAGDDSMLGGSGSDTLRGDFGNDALLGQNDSDSLDGGDGADTMSGEEGNDSLNGMEGTDSLTGGIGQDTLLGGAGNDTLDGGRNDDFLQGNDGDDKIRGDHGNDTLKADGGNDTINGGDGDDSIDGGDGHDAINAEDGNDTVSSGMGNDILVGGDGNDVLLSGGGSDVVLGGDGNDTINAQSGADTVAGNQGNDVIADPTSEIIEAFLLSANVIATLEAL